MKKGKLLAVVLMLLLAATFLTGCDEAMLEEMLEEMGFDSQRWEELEKEMTDLETYSYELKFLLSPEEQIAFDARLEEMMEEKFGDIDTEMEERMAAAEAVIEEQMDKGEITEEEAMDRMMEVMASAIIEMLKLMEEAVPFMQESLDTLVEEFNIDVTAIPDRMAGLVYIVMTIDMQQARVNDQFVALDQAPVIQNGRTLVPLRFISEELGATVEWNPDNRTVTYTTPDTQILLAIDNPVAYVNGIPVEIDVAPTILNGRTLVPVRFVGEQMGFEIDWLPDSRQVIITNE
ncbi:MAG: copper amine oxidase N-terminal domain-containing protein [Bacillota bacterium]|nr:copper amine oxidase N-terminal domain-containing protein [Bacillota bacterium]MDW7678702.1 copper amine oxidase N-terminal domain-containing protein [Bacillota bacterium]